MPEPHEPAGGASRPVPEEVGYRGTVAMRAAGISYRQLDYWARTGLVVPSVRPAAGAGTQRLYSFRDIVVLKVVKSLLDAGVSLQNIRKAIETLRAHGVNDLAGLTLISDGTTVYECRSAEEVVDLLQGGQGVFGIAIGGACREIEGTLTNLPADHTTPEQWRNLVSGLASASTMYRYPSGEEWPFILPSTSDELVGDIRTFVTGREPRFELVYDRWSRKTTWQFALWTDLTRTELERLFPGPEGTTIGGLEEIFRVVAVQSPWPGLGIRFDLCYRIEDSPSDWETGEWLVTEGGRIR